MEFELEVLDEKCLKHDLLAQPIEFFPLGQVLDGDFSLNVVSVVVDPRRARRRCARSTPARGECEADEVVDGPVWAMKPSPPTGIWMKGHGDRPTC